MLEKWKSALGKGGNVCVLFMDLLKAFDTINHDLLLTKSKAYDFFKKCTRTNLYYYELICTVTNAYYMNYV